MADVMKEHRARKSRNVEAGDAKLSFGQAAAIHMQRIDDRVTIKKGTRKYWRQTLAALFKSWPELSAKPIRKITTAACREFAIRYGKVASSNRYNNTVSLLRHIFGVAVKNGVLYTNPADELEHVAVKGKTLELPTLAKFGEFIAEMRKAHSRDSKNCADLAEGLAYTGVRIGGSGEIMIRDLSFEKGEIRVKGDPEDGTKNGEKLCKKFLPKGSPFSVSEGDLENLCNALHIKDFKLLPRKHCVK